MLTSDIENFPGYPEGIEGPHMMKDLKKQVDIYVMLNISTWFLTFELTAYRRLSDSAPML